MGLGTVTLLEINQVPTGKRIAYCLPSGAFIFVADTCASEFGADNAADLYGANLLQYLTLGDAEKLEDFLRAQQQRGDGVMFSPSQQMRIVVRLSSNPSTQLWIHLSTIPLTLRMMRCIDTISSLSNPLSQFADSSSFVLSEDEFSSMMRNPPPESHMSMLGAGIASLSVDPMDDDDDLMFMEFENSCMSPISFTSIVPLELKHRHPNFAMTHSHDDIGTEEVTREEDLKASLSNLAFEADWSSEMFDDDEAHALFPAEPITPSATNSVP